MTEPAHTGDFSVRAMSCGSPNSCTIVANDLPNTSPIIERWNGSRWLSVRLPTATGSSDVAIGAISCPTTRRCVAVGGVTNDDGEGVPLAEASLNFQWSEQVVPAAMMPVPSALNAVWCSRAASCLAVGRAQESALAYQWSGAAWSAQSTPQLQASTLLGLTDISCSAATACTGVGAVSGPGETMSPLAEQWDGAQWQTLAISPPAGAVTSYLKGVSCPASGACVAVGDASAQTDLSDGYPLVERWDGNAWSLESAPSPAAAANSALGGVSCSSDTACQAVGNYESASNRNLPLAEGRSGAGWVEETVPLPAGSATGQLAAVSCVSDDWCVAAGGAAAGTGRDAAFIVTWDGSGWNVATVPGPTGATSTDLSGISCVSQTACTAVGDYLDSGGHENPLVEQWNGSTWTIDPGPALPTGTSLDGVSCSSDGSCTVVGYYPASYADASDQPVPISAQLS